MKRMSFYYKGFDLFTSFFCVAYCFQLFIRFPKQFIRLKPFFCCKTNDNFIWQDLVFCMKDLDPSKIVESTIEEREKHFHELHRKINTVVPYINETSCYIDYCGPWLEDVWLDNFSRLPFNSFGFFIPLFVPWLNLWHFRHGKYRKIVHRVLSLLSEKYIYITLTQNDNGIEGSDNGVTIPGNLFVISAGGKGHVPFLLFSKELTTNKQSLANINNKSFEYEYEATFMGTITTHSIRTKMIELMKQNNQKTYIGHANNWIEIYENSDFIMTPRGYGRNSFRLTETLQLGFIPVYIYNDIPWVPYYDSINWSKFGIIISESQLDNLSNIMKSLSKETRREMRRNIISHYDSHFSRSGAFKQLSNFLVSGFSGSDLRCSFFSHQRGK
ncbi:hypothetical protein TRFO_27280 [Tritrichomonas foetus]|uniref:Exostosin GT47 domain-containing protein n=1 Tax=Tritrichomonas foetus TaxID=1144522 RepID=A0A1J4K1N4_9EUKA|nr:hypothetical protein TRFO_27280 [Tritrichomonas foetus]|eukprot:OHT05147.1 hypothetical protein TRFO_27280 [Tritrichomonas foetus]